MQRMFRLTFLAALFCLVATVAVKAQDNVYVSGRVAPGNVRVFLKDSTYIINNDFIIGGTLIIEPGTVVKFNPNSRMIDSTGGRIIADGFASAVYNEFPNNVDPIRDWQNEGQYAAYGYFSYEGGGESTIDITTDREITVDDSKANYVYNLVLNTNTGKLEEFENYADPNNPVDVNQRVPGQEHLMVISYEQAIMWRAARLERADEDVNIKTTRWKRWQGRTVDIAENTITFEGNPINNYTNEWGHIIVLPGARAAFFRNVVFDNFKKELTVDRVSIYEPKGRPWVQAINNKMNELTNGAGAALTTFASRTWLIDVTFTNNQARLRGGALQILQAPVGFPRIYNQMDVYTDNMMLAQDAGVYPADKNPNITERNADPSAINANIPMIDELDSDDPEFFEGNDGARQAYDDARLGVFLGRYRRLTFEGNKAQLAKVGENEQGVITDLLNEPAPYPTGGRNHAFGGAVYIAGVDNQEQRHIEIGLGVNNSLMIDGELVEFDDLDYIYANNNEAGNYQASAGTEGAKGGAIYVGPYTSLIVAGTFTNNSANAKYFTDPEYMGVTSGRYAQGGAIYTENAIGRLQVRGNPRNENLYPTHFMNNTAGSGGAIYVDGNVDPMMSPIIGGSDGIFESRDYGFDIIFEKNHAIAYGGAVVSKRNMVITGAGGTAEGVSTYGGKYTVKLDSNTAGYAGGGLYIDIPSAYYNRENMTEQEVQDLIERHIIHITRAEFNGNVVGMDVAGDQRFDIRGGGAVYALNGDLNLVKATQFRGNTVYNGNGGAVALVHPESSTKRYFLSDLDRTEYEAGTQIVNNYVSEDDVFTYTSEEYPADVRMMTRFLDNKVMVDQDVLDSQSGSGTTQVGKGTLPVTENIFGTYWLNNETGYVVGYNGLVVKLTNAGANWDYQKSGTKWTLNDVEFVNSMTGYAVGDAGTVIKTTNGGADWTTLSTPTTNDINDIDFIGTDIGYAVCSGGEILKTVNAGASWTVMQPGTNDLYSVSFTGVNKGYAVGESGSVLVTENGGNTWDFQVITGLSANLYKIFFRSASNGYAVGAGGTVLMTEDAGATWAFVNSGTAVKLNSVFFSGQADGWIVGNAGTVLKTNDGGESWTQIDTDVLGTTWNINDVFFTSRTDGHVVGDYGIVIRTEDGGDTWNEIRPSDESKIDIVRFHPYVGLPENGVGLGGALYVLDSATVNRVNRADSIFFNRVRFQQNESYTGSAIYSDNFDLKLILNRSLVNGNIASSEIGMDQNVVTGPVVRDASDEITKNVASSDLVGATIYGEVQGPLPSYMYSEAANSIYGNEARFLIRLPDAPNTKGVLAGDLGIGFGGTDTLRGNYWGETQANVNMIIKRTGSEGGAIMETFYVDYATTQDNRLNFLVGDVADPRDQGPFESPREYGPFEPIPLTNGADQTLPGDMSIPENVLFSGRIYDIYDKGTDIKTADYSKRRMSPIEDFAVGIPPIVKRFNNDDMPSYGKYIKRWTRNPHIAEMTDDEGNPVYPSIAAYQTEFKADPETGEYYHPIGYPLFLETNVDYSGEVNINNFDSRMKNQTVAFVINETTGDFIRANLTQVDNENNRERFLTVVELVPDSSNRRPNTLYRRTLENLANFGSGKQLLEKLSINPYPGEVGSYNGKAPYNEDKATLPGRRWGDDDNLMGGVPNLFSNRPGMPAENNIGGKQVTTFFGGERYNALPVKAGDVVRVVSRTVLWREGVVEAFDDGISFEIRESTEPPVFIDVAEDSPQYPYWDDIPSLMNKEPEEFQNRIFVTEDRTYPAVQGTYTSLPIYGDDDPFTESTGGRGRDYILHLAALDSNMFNDPRLEHNDNEDILTSLEYDWYAAPNSAVSRWLFSEVIPKNGSSQYGFSDLVEFTGRPMNPFVVPGGESVTVTASNYPPMYRNLDLMREEGLSQDVIDQHVETYPGYMNSGDADSLYYTDLARYLQQDTVNVGPNYTREYTFDLHVVNIPPQFLDDDFEAETVYYPNDDEKIYVEYLPSDYTCGKTDEGTLIANMTWQAASPDLAKLRFQADFNTTDEMEDHSPAAQGWDFRYGRTSYGFVNKSIRPGTDTTTVDSTDYDDDPYTVGDTMLVDQSRPDWMADAYFFEYGTDNSADQFAADFTTYGQLNIRIPYDDAFELIKPVEDNNEDEWYNNYLNTDTVFTLVVNDGHGAVISRRIPVKVNVQPRIMTDEELPIAYEGQDYNPQLLDKNKMIRVYDPNFDQDQTYRLIYPSTTETSIPFDACYPEAGEIDLSTLKTTPEWLKINPQSGLLYGEPGVQDAPATEQVVVVVTDAQGLSTYKTFTIEVMPSPHDPYVEGGPEVECIDQGSEYSQTFVVGDLDLTRENSDETLTIELWDYNDQPIQGMTVTPATISGPQSDPETIITISTNDFDVPVDPNDNKITIKVVVTDSDGNTTIRPFKLQKSLETDFVATIEVANNNRTNKYSYQLLEFGTSPIQSATTGDQTDGNPMGTIDDELCENEIPPLPQMDVFDARWTIPQRNGIYRNIYPSNNINKMIFTYVAKYQAGGEDGSTSPKFPVVISWRPDEIPSVAESGSKWWIQDIYSKGNFFGLDMHNPDEQIIGTGIIARWRNNDETTGWYEVVVTNSIVNGFLIVYDVNNSVIEQPGMIASQTGITNVSPNPVNDNTNIEFELLKSSEVKIEVVNGLGQVVNTLVDGQSYSSGTYKLDWNGTDAMNTKLGSGAYQIRLTTGSTSSSYPVVIVK